MSLEVLLFVIRLAGALCLVGFVVLVFQTIRSDMRLTAVQVESRQKSYGQLVVIGAEDVALEPGTTFPLLPVTTFGRAPANTAFLPDSFASNHHALLTLRSGRWWLEDRESRNGTTLNGQLLDGPTVVSAGDVIGVGRVELKVELE